MIEKEKKTASNEGFKKQGNTLFGNVLDDFIPPVQQPKPTLKTVDEIYRKMKKENDFR